LTILNWKLANVVIKCSISQQKHVLFCCFKTKKVFYLKKTFVVKHAYISTGISNSLNSTEVTDVVIVKYDMILSNIVFEAGGTHF